MSQLELNQDQCQALRDTLNVVLPNLSYEIADTDLKSFRDNLKEKRDHLKDVLQMLEVLETVDVLE